MIVSMKTGLLTKGAFVALAMAGGTTWVLATDDNAAPRQTVSPAAARTPNAAVQAAGPGANGPRTTPQKRTLGAPEKVFEIAYGSRANELGGEVPPEGLPECPGAVSVGPDGALYVLDQINERIVKMQRGRENELIDLPARTFFDLSIAPDGTLVLLDKLVGESIALVDPSGVKKPQELSIRNKFVDQPGEITGVYARNDGVWLEHDNQVLIQIADTEGKQTLKRLNGRLSRDGSHLLRAGIVGKRSVAVSQQPFQGGRAVESTVTFDTDVDYVTQLATDGNENLWLVVALVDELAPGQTRNAHTEVILLDRAGHEMTRSTLPARDESWLQGRAYEVSADGSLYHLSCGRHAATLWRVSL